MLLFSCSKYDDRKVEGVWLLEHVNLCVSNRCFDTLEDRGTRAEFDKIELRLDRERNANGRFYNSGILIHQFNFEYVLDEKMGRISFIGPDDFLFPQFFGTHVKIEELSKTQMVYIAIENFPDEELAYIYSAFSSPPPSGKRHPQCGLSPAVGL